MAIDLNKSGEEKPRSRFNLSKTSESSSVGNENNLDDKPKKKIDLSKPSQSSAQFTGNKESTYVNTPEKSKSNKTVIFVLLGIVCLVALIWFFANTIKSPNQQGVGTERPTSNDKVSSKANPTSNSEGNVNPNLADSTQSQKPAKPAIQPSLEMPASSVNNEVKNTPKQETPVTANIPYKKNEAYKVYQFPFGEFNYSQANPELDKLAEVLKQNPSMNISITAYTDDIGPEDINMTISLLRAKSIHEYLVNKGINAVRMKFQGKGISTKYVTKAENRRAEFVLSE